MIFDLIGTEGWEYQGEKKQYIYGEWTVTGVRKGDTCRGNGSENEFCVVFYEFSEDCFWDKMILKDEMTVVLVKDNNYFWAKRMSEKDPAGLYGSYF